MEISEPPARRRRTPRPPSYRDYERGPDPRVGGHSCLPGRPR